MVASRQVEILFHRGAGRQRGRGFGALAQIIGRTANPFLPKYIVQAEKCVGADLLELAVPEIAVVVSGRKNIKTAAKTVGRQTLRKQLESGSRRMIASRVIPKKLHNKTIGREEIFFEKLFSLIMSGDFCYQPAVAVSGKLGGKVPVVDDVLSSHEQEVYPTTSIDKNCKNVEFQTYRNFYVDLKQTYLVFKLILVKDRGYETYNNKDVKNEHKEEANVEEETVEQEPGVPVPLDTSVNYILHSIFSNVDVYINNQQRYNSNEVYAHKPYNYNNFEENRF